MGASCLTFNDFVFLSTRSDSNNLLNQVEQFLRIQGLLGGVLWISSS